MNLAYFVGGPLDGTQIELEPRRQSIEAFERNIPFSSWDPRAGIDRGLRTVQYRPAVLGGFLWYPQ